METITEQELQEIFELLERSGMEPMLCDTPVPYYENGVWAGIPTAPGDIVQGDYTMLPNDLIGWQPVFVVPVKGDSMRDANIMPGDYLRVQITNVVSDGDIVVAEIDGECTVKAFYSDEQGKRWLVPCNDNYDAIPLTEDMNVRIVGKVVECIKEAPRMPYRDCLKVIRRTRMAKKENISPKRVEDAVRTVAEQVKNGRHWYAVYRTLVDRGVVSDGDYTAFADLVADIVPEHGHLPVAGEMRRMAVQSFSKQVALWERDDAPVSGLRFDDYLRLARMTSGLLK